MRLGILHLIQVRARSQRQNTKACGSGEHDSLASRGWLLSPAGVSLGILICALSCGRTRHFTAAGFKSANPQIGARAGTNQNCGNGPGQCACTGSAGGSFCGTCQADAPNICVYCDSGTFCPADPCGSGCFPDNRSTCPPGFDFDCGNGSCCPLKFPACCPGGTTCGEESSDCEEGSGATSGPGTTNGSAGTANLVCVIFTDNFGNSACSCMPPPQAPRGYSTTTSCPANDCCLAFNPPKGGITCECNSNASNARNYGQAITCAAAAQKAQATAVPACP